MTPRELRHELHRFPELSGAETETARRILDFFRPLGADQTWTGLGGTGSAFAFGTPESGPTVLLRCELDALPIHESMDLSYRSTRPGVGHKCGHDGHMAILGEVGRRLAVRRPSRGRVVLLFQPAEETGAGASAVLADPRFAEIQPDVVYALHNLPGFPLGEVVVKDGSFNCASRGLTARFSGRTSHAAEPENGLSPAGAMAATVTGLTDLRLEGSGESAFVTVVGARLGEKAFGTAPGEAEVYATLRTESDEAMADLVTRAEDLVREAAARDGLRCEIAYEDVFAATANAPEAVERVRRAVSRLGMTVREMDCPFRWSEDFGRFTATCQGALFGLGAGEEHPALHHPDYDFPDALIETGAELLVALIDDVLGTR